MRAVVYDRYGPPDVLRLAEVPKPAVGDGDVLVRVRASTVSRLDCHIREANRSNGPPFSAVSRLVSGVRGPRRPILGSEFAGEVEATGAAVTEFKAGDRLFGNTGLRFGCHAEFVSVPASARIGLMPEKATFEEAAPLTDGAFNALSCLRQPDIGKGRPVLVYGASGAIGTAGVQLAKTLFGAEVTAVCNTRNVELVRSLGADHVIDYTREDFTRNGERYDVILDASGRLRFLGCRSSLSDRGWFLPTDGAGNLGWALWPFGRRRVTFPRLPRDPRQDVTLLRELVDTGQFRAVVDRTYPMGDVVEAARYVETGQKTGNVVLAISP